MDISIGDINLTGNVVLAPMSGVTDLPYRRLAKKHGAALVVSEMIASREMIYANKKNYEDGEKLCGRVSNGGSISWM